MELTYQLSYHTPFMELIKNTEQSLSLLWIQVSPKYNLPSSPPWERTALTWQNGEQLFEGRHVFTHQNVSMSPQGWESEWICIWDPERTLDLLHYQPQRFWSRLPKRLTHNHISSTVVRLRLTLKTTWALLQWTVSNKRASQGVM